MRIFNRIILSASIVLSAISMQSCDESIAYTLEGTWQGDMFVQSYYNNRYYTTTYSVVNFQKNPFKYASGEGYWIDYYSDAPWGNCVANHIKWKVNKGVIRIHFREDNEDVEIRDYRLNDERFEGYIGESSTFFSLVHTSSPNWNNYSYGWNNTYFRSIQSKNSKEEAKKPVRIFKKTDLPQE